MCAYYTTTTTTTKAYRFEAHEWEDEERTMMNEFYVRTMTTFANKWCEALGALGESADPRA